jgi:hypothetical protein
MSHNKSGVDLTTHPLLIFKEPGSALVALRNELPLHPEIFTYANQGATIEDCLGRIATKLDIALDGEYNLDDLCGLLMTCLAAKRQKIPLSEIHKLAGLTQVELIERENTVELAPTEITQIAPQEDSSSSSNKEKVTLQ